MATKTNSIYRTRGLYYDVPENCINYNNIDTYKECCSYFFTILYNMVPYTITNKFTPGDPKSYLIYTLWCLNSELAGGTAFQGVMHSLINNGFNVTQAKEFCSKYLLNDLKDELFIHLDWVLFDTYYTNSLIQSLYHVYNNVIVKYRLADDNNAIRFKCPCLPKSEELRAIRQRSALLHGQEVINAFYESILKSLINTIIKSYNEDTSYDDEGLNYFKKNKQIAVLRFNDKTHDFKASIIFNADEYKYSDIIDYLQAPNSPQAIELGIVNELRLLTTIEECKRVEANNIRSYWVKHLSYNGGSCYE